ncbi:glycosyl hydrolase family 28-related protein [Haliscomenobacter sp.]|uniref:glycosyl hydrolase family 28-related protein n=1 Tax=Haliscomenobacter sp. TaxID=2717303 RepID=UPI003364E2C3
MAIVQISRITQRKGLAIDLPEPLAGAELGWSTDTRRLYIGNGTTQEGAPVVGNTEVLTEFSDILSYATEYTYQGESASYAVQTGASTSTPVSQSLQSRLDSNAIITDFGATGDGVTDVTANINRALYQLYCRQINPQIRRSLYFPAGTYIISDTLNIPPYCNLYGDGPEGTIIYFYVQTWTSTVAYATGVLVKNGSSYYRSVAAVPTGASISDTVYWTATTLPGYIFRTADSLQQTGANIGLNGALQPGSFEISNMKFMTNMVHDGCLAQAAQDCAFESVNISGPETTSTLTTSGSGTACVRFDTTASYVCSNIEWNHGTFTGMTWGTNTDEQIEGVTFSNCSFDTLYQGVYLGNNTPPAVGPTGFRIVENNFDNIYAEGISIVNVGMNCSAYNAFYDVGNHFLGTDNPSTPVIDIDGTNNVSVGDMFERTTEYSTGVHPRIQLNNLNGVALGMNVSNITFYQNNSDGGGTPYNFANQLAIGTYQRMAGITDTLADNVSSARTLLTFDAVYIKAVQINYTITRGTAIRTGVYTIVAGTDASGTGLQGSDTGVQNSAPGQTFSVTEAASVVSWKYVTTSTGAAGTIYYSVTKLA